MFRDRDEELRRLEEALLEEEEEEQKQRIEEEIEEERQKARRDEAEEEEEDDISFYQPDDTEDDEADTFPNYANNYRAYNSDRVDVDLDEYSEQIRQEPKRGSCLLTLALILLCGILVMLILFLLKFQGLL